MQNVDSNILHIRQQFYEKKKSAEQALYFATELLMNVTNGLMHICDNY